MVVGRGFRDFDWASGGRWRAEGIRLYWPSQPNYYWSVRDIDRADILKPFAEFLNRFQVKEDVALVYWQDCDISVIWGTASLENFAAAVLQYDSWDDYTASREVGRVGPVARALLY